MISNNHRPILSPNALYLLHLRYLQRDVHGRVTETPARMFRRVAEAVASIENNYDSEMTRVSWADRYYRLMAGLDFLPNSPTLLNAGRLSGTLSSCFAVPVGGSPRAMSNSIQQAVTVHLNGGGTGFNFSRLPPKNGVDYGPVAYIAPFSDSLEAVKQGGIRRGCSIAVLDVRHPDILEFIKAKDHTATLTNFYLSVGVTDAFMQAALAGKAYDLIEPGHGEVVGQLDAREVLNRISTQTWKTGDPGLVFLDRLERDNPTPHLGKLEGVSGCGEQSLLPYESCNLGSINLARMLATDRGRVAIDYGRLEETVRVAVRFLDNVIDINRFPLPQIADMTRQTRKIGLGVMGFADMLIQLGIPYDSEEALKTAGEVMAFIDTRAHAASQKLAEERGAFPAYPGSVYDKAGGPRMRNASCTTIAPTGTISIIAGCSNGIEPLFALVFVRHVQGGRSLLEVNPWLVNIAQKRGIYSEGLIRQLARGTGLADLAAVPGDFQSLFTTALQIRAEWHVRIQAAFQKHVDNALSKTVNLPQGATIEDVVAVYVLAYRQGLKGITIYRDHSRKRQPLGSGFVSEGLLEEYFTGDQHPVTG